MERGGRSRHGTHRCQWIFPLCSRRGRPAATSPLQSPISTWAISSGSHAAAAVPAPVPSARTRSLALIPRPVRCTPSTCWSAATAIRGRGMTPSRTRSLRYSTLTRMPRRFGEPPTSWCGLSEEPSSRSWPSRAKRPPSMTIRKAWCGGMPASSWATSPLSRRRSPSHSVPLGSRPSSTLPISR